MNILCFLTVRPSELCCDFIKKIKNKIGMNYSVFICADDNNYSVPLVDDDIKIIQIDKKESESFGFKNTVCYFPKTACSKDKALYYFCKKTNIDYKNIWFIEEDVFIPNESTILNIDKKYPIADVLSAEYSKKTMNSKWYWMGTILKECLDKIPLPYYFSMVCAVRLSRELMNKIATYAEIHKTLHYDEIIFLTLANKNKLTIIVIPELSEIHFRKNFDLNYNYNSNKLYHPIKSIELQHEIRKKMNNY